MAQSMWNQPFNVIASYGKVSNQGRRLKSMGRRPWKLSFERSRTCKKERLLMSGERVPSSALSDRLTATTLCEPMLHVTPLQLQKEVLEFQFDSAL